MAYHPTPVNILLVEDNEGDIVLVQEALQSAKIANDLHIIRDGAKAIGYLKDTMTDGEPDRPSLIMLDLNLPKVSGLEILDYIKSDDSLKIIPVVIMTSSQAEEDIAKAYKLQANCYITKPVGFDELVMVVRSIETFWLSVVQLPPQAVA